MTIAVGFPYQDGVLVCADSQITSPNGLKYSENKISSLDVQGARCIFVFADQVGLAKEIRDKIFRKLEEYLKASDIEVSSQELYDAGEAVINDYGRHYAELPLEFLIAMYPSKEAPLLLHFDGKSLNKRTDFVVLGCGRDSLTRFLVENLFSPELDWHHALSLGCYVVKKATQYIQGCGGPIEAFRLTSNEITEVQAKDVEWADVITLQQEINLDKWLFKRV